MMFLTVVTCSSMTDAATLLNTNLIINGDGESAPGATTFSESVPIPGWTTTGSFTTVQYAIGGAIDLNSDDSTAITGGANYFAGGPSASLSTASQVIAFSGLSTFIDSGQLSARLSGFIGGYAAQNDRMQVFARFLDESNNLLGSFGIGPVTNDDRENISQLLFRTSDSTVPVGTRSVEILMQATISSGSYNDGYADNLDFQLIPEPSVTLIGAIGVLTFFRRRREQITCSAR